MIRVSAEDCLTIFRNSKEPCLLLSAGDTDETGLLFLFLISAGDSAGPDLLIMLLLSDGDLAEPGILFLAVISAADVLGLHDYQNINRFRTSHCHITAN